MALLVLILLASDIIIGFILKKKFYIKNIDKETELKLLPNKLRYLLSFGLLICLYLVAIKNMHYSYVLIFLYALSAFENYLKTIKLYKLDKYKKSYYYTLFKLVSSLILMICIIVF
ncbi:hypothetical protein [[Clostridium] dakarense]|uniref:hypothetical protein n=1 Tax=Faecalimicrobium dakarense TaxID=1301100 RepID=UPI0005AA95B9|nr:hypothetical protein [[Clostridium] dakarense]